MAPDKPEMLQGDSLKWFKHDTDAIADAKIRKLIMKYGAVGYAIYFHCIELIAGDVAETNITFQLEHDAEIIADNLRINGDASKSGAEKVMEIMSYMIELKLFEASGGRVFCFKLLKRIDSSMLSAGSQMRNLIASAKENYQKSHDLVMTESCYTRLEETRLDKTRLEETKRDKPAQARTTRHKYGLYLNVLLSDSEYLTLSETIPELDKLIETMSNYCQAHGKRYKDYAAALRQWAAKDRRDKPDPSKLNL